jgi:hypothetical protein
MVLSSFVQKDVKYENVPMDQLLQTQCMKNLKMEPWMAEGIKELMNLFAEGKLSHPSPDVRNIT